jgi:hypothetical protein
VIVNAMTRDLLRVSTGGFSSDIRFFFQTANTSRWPLWETLTREPHQSKLSLMI